MIIPAVPLGADPRAADEEAILFQRRAVLRDLVLRRLAMNHPVDLRETREQDRRREETMALFRLLFSHARAALRGPAARDAPPRARSPNGRMQHRMRHGLPKVALCALASSRAQRAPAMRRARLPCCRDDHWSGGSPPSDKSFASTGLRAILSASVHPLMIWKFVVGSGVA